MPRSERVGTEVDESDLGLPEGSRGKEGGRYRGPPLSLFFLAAVLFGVGYFGYQEFRERLAFLHEEDARIQANLVTVSSRVAGWVTQVVAYEGLAVEAGTTLVTMDQRKAEVFIEELTAELGAVAAEKVRLRAEQDLVKKQIESHLNSVRLALSAARVTVSSLKPQLQLAKRDLERNRKLFRQRVVSRRQLDQSETRLQRIEREHRIALANFESAEAKIKEAEVQRAQTKVLAGELTVLSKREVETEAKIRRHRFDLEDLIIKSPLKGIVDRTFVEVGEYVTPGQRLMLVHDPWKIWVEANIKETEVRRLAIGQKVHVSVDAYPDERFEGSIERIGNTATSAFALLPSPNPSGNFTKITQRLPVRIAIEQRGGRLRPGMMVEIKIVTGG